MPLLYTYSMRSFSNNSQPFGPEKPLKCHQNIKADDIFKLCPWCMKPNKNFKPNKREHTYSMVCKLSMNYSRSNKISVLAHYTALI